MPTPDGLRTMRKAAARLGCSVKTLAGHIAAGALRYVVVGHGTKRRRKMLTDAELAEFIESKPQGLPSMSVYKDPRSPFWEFDFQLGGHRFHSSTKCTTRREAEAVERSERENKQATKST